jgi:hypothetical protein
VIEPAAGQDTGAVHGRCLLGSESPRTWTGSGGREPVHDAGIESAEITASTANQAAKLLAGPVLDDLRRGVPATPGNMTDLIQPRQAWRPGAGARPVPQRVISKAGGRQAAGRDYAGRSR